MAVRSSKKSNRSKGKKGREKNRRLPTGPPGRGIHPVVRWAARAAAIVVSTVAVVGLCILIVAGFRRVLFAANPGFTCDHIVVNTDGRLQKSEIRQLVRECGVREGRTNLFEIDLQRLRERIRRASPLVREVHVIRRLPDTLEVEIRERDPIAQLLVPGGRLIDRNGVILPARPEVDVALLPVIVGARNIRQLPTGATVRDPMVRAALNALELIRTEGLNRVMEPVLVQLDYSRKRLICYVREDDCFRKDAQVILPVTGVRAALWRVQQIVRERKRAHQTLRFLDATYEKNVPIRP